ncbi:hypothetical protein CDAR_467621 [Caerostris darwini]|uniref:Uncharacterized protein n=1 Tax=Caerostris darwini TaxID=1538125 RepID=A0AAV4SP78_9ARAC|nr:hypothetical protein CDAR_467621 [Caerostris darwini]
MLIQFGRTVARLRCPKLAQRFASSTLLLEINKRTFQPTGISSSPLKTQKISTINFKQLWLHMFPKSLLSFPVAMLTFSHILSSSLNSVEGLSNLLIYNVHLWRKETKFQFASLTHL